MNPRDLSPGELLRATRDAGIVWCLRDGCVDEELPDTTSNRKLRCRVESLLRECDRRGLAFEGFVELVLYSEAMG